MAKFTGMDPARMTYRRFFRYLVAAESADRRSFAGPEQGKGRPRPAFG